MFSHPPKLDYRGLTILVSNPSRFDKAELLSGNAGYWFCNEALRPGMNRWQCHILDCDAWNKANRALLDNTKVVMCLGNRAQCEFMEASDVTLGAQRGSPKIITHNGNEIVAISSYLPQDAFDFKDYEQYLNPYLNPHLVQGQEGRESDESNINDDGDSGDSDAKSRHGKTARSNWRFWLAQDTKKCVRICKEGWHPPREPEYRIYPNSNEVLDVLLNYENEKMFLDIETDSNLNITCLGFSFGRSGCIYVLPLLRYNYTIAYQNIGKIMAGLARAFARNTVIAHNGACFDFFVLPYRYKISCGRNLEDTMIMAHRIYPEIEKSLGHCISLYTDLPFHKDEGIFEPQSEEQEYKLWKYNGKDVYGMREVYYNMLDIASIDKGLAASFKQANASIRPYLTAGMQGMRFNWDNARETIAYNDRCMTQLMRLLIAAIGKENYKICRGTGKEGLPNSSAQCVRYFYDICGYPILSYGKVSKITGKRKPKLDEKNLLRLKLKHNNPVIDIILEYRGLSKESGSLKFNPWHGIGKPLIKEEMI